MQHFLRNKTYRFCIAHTEKNISLSTVKLYGFPIFRTSENNLPIGFTQKNRLECIGKAVMMLYLEATSRIFRPTANFENFKIHLYFVCQPAVRPGCARCTAPEISNNKGNGGRFTKMLFRRRFQYPLRHGDSFYPSFPSLFL